MKLLHSDMFFSHVVQPYIIHEANSFKSLYDRQTHYNLRDSD